MDFNCLCNPVGKACSSHGCRFVILQDCHAHHTVFYVDEAICFNIVTNRDENEMYIVIRMKVIVRRTGARENDD